MAPSFFCFLPLRKNPATKINTTLQPTPPFSRIMASGRCTAVVAVGTFEVFCPCPRGKFDAPLNTLDVGCKLCTHPLSQHEDASSTPVPGSFLLPQGMASLISSLHFSQLMDMFQSQPMPSHVHGKIRSLHSGISLKNIRLFMFEAHLPAGSPRWLNFSKLT